MPRIQLDKVSGRYRDGRVGLQPTDLVIESGELADLIDDGVTGVTSNPAIFEKAIAGSADYDAALLPLAVAFLSAARDAITRRISSGDSSTATLAITTGVIVLGGVAMSLVTGWVPLRAGDLWLFVLCALFQGSAHFLMIETFRLAEAKVVAPFKYTSILWAVLIGYLFWNDIPDGWILTGGSIVVASGLYILHRERQR